MQRWNCVLTLDPLMERLANLGESSKLLAEPHSMKTGGFCKGLGPPGTYCILYKFILFNLHSLHQHSHHHYHGHHHWLMIVQPSICSSLSPSLSTSLSPQSSLIDNCPTWHLHRFRLLGSSCHRHVHVRQVVLAVFKEFSNCLQWNLRKIVFFLHLCPMCWNVLKENWGPIHSLLAGPMWVTISTWGRCELW